MWSSPLAQLFKNTDTRNLTSPSAPHSYVSCCVMPYPGMRCAACRPAVSFMPYVPSALLCPPAQGFKELNLIYFFTAGETEVRCWTILKGTMAPQAAGVIHTDFERGFIKAEVGLVGGGGSTVRR